MGPEHPGGPARGAPGGAVSLPGLGGPERPAAAITARVKAWVRAELADDDPRSVMITELACTEPGCPPLETVIALLGPGDQTQHKIHKPLAEVTEPEVIGALRGSHCT